MHDYIVIAFFAAAFEAFIGYPVWVARYVPHPVIWVGKFINYADNFYNNGVPRKRKIAGIILAFLLLSVPFSIGRIIENIIGGVFPDFLSITIIVLIATIGIAQNSLYHHVYNVLDALDRKDIELAHLEVSKIVGRDTSGLDENGVASAAIETLSESFCDAVIAPIFWLSTFGIGGLFAFKSISTADSMIGHYDDKYREFGMASARTDDVLNFIPARIAGFLICMVGGGFKIMLRDNHKHQSPNSAWPEAAMAGAIGRRLGGGAYYDGEFIARPCLGDGDAPNAKDLEKALYTYMRACGLALIILGILAWTL